MLQSESRGVAFRQQIENNARSQAREVLQTAWSQEAKLRNLKKAIEAIEHGKRVPGSSVSVSAPQPRAIDGVAGDTCLSARRAFRSGTPRHNVGSAGAPLSARGESLGTAATLALQGRRAVAEVGG